MCHMCQIRVSTEAHRHKKNHPLSGGFMVARAGIEPATFRFSGGRSYQLSYLAGRQTQLLTASPYWRP